MTCERQSLFQIYIGLFLPWFLKGFFKYLELCSLYNQEMICVNDFKMTLDLTGVDAIMCVEWSMIFTFASQLVITF